MYKKVYKSAYRESEQTLTLNKNLKIFSNFVFYFFIQNNSIYIIENVNDNLLNKKVSEEKFINCTHQYKCLKPQSAPELSLKQSCGLNAICGVDVNNNPACTCANGFTGDGFTCQSNKKINKNKKQLI